MDEQLVSRRQQPTRRFPGWAAVQSTLEAAATKIFLAGFCWQAGALVSGLGSESVGFAVASGSGDALGTFAGHLVLVCAPVYWRGWEGWRSVLCAGAVVSTGSLLSGTVWQPMVNGLSRAGLSFEVGMLLTGAACGAAFYTGITAAARLLRQPHDLVKDATLSTAVAGATAAFVGTDMRWHGNWLQAVVGERTGSSAALDCFKSGLSTCIGFVALQLLLILVVPSRFLWTTPPPAATTDGIGPERGIEEATAEEHTIGITSIAHSAHCVAADQE